MDDLTDLVSKEREERWQAWLSKGRARDQAMARKAKVFVVVLVMLVALGLVAYRFGH